MVGLVNNKLEGIWKKANCSLTWVLSWQLTAWTEENHENLKQDVTLHISRSSTVWYVRLAMNSVLSYDASISKVWLKVGTMGLLETVRSC